MPIQNCQVDRKPGYRYGQSGKCYIYKEGDKASQTRARNKARKQGIAQIINSFEFSLAKQKVSFDYDETLSTDKGKSLAKERISAGDEVYIITARQESDDNTSLFNVASELGIAKDHIFFTNGKDKWEEIKKLGINTHYDNSQEQIDKINENTDARGIKI